MAVPHHPARSVGWLDLLASASTEEEVLWVAKDFLSRLSPAEVASLPRECRPVARLMSHADIVDYAFVLAQVEKRDRSNDVLSHTAAFFANASQRAAELMSEVGPPQPGNR